MNQRETDYVELLGRWIAHARSLKVKPAQLTMRHRASEALLQVCRDHCLSIFILLKAGEGHVNASALALLRSALEACVTGGWLGKHLTDEGFEKYRSNLDSEFPSRVKCLQELQSHIHPLAFDALDRHMKEVKHVYADFAHGGHQQILRRFDTNGSIGRLGTEEETRSLVKNALLYDMTAAQWIAEIMRDDDVKSALLQLAKELDALSVLGSELT